MNEINTIFYFPTSLTFQQYTQMLNNNEISEKTIVFADAQKAIYKGGKKYGGVSVSEFNEMVETLYDDSWIKNEIDGIKGDISDQANRISGVNTLIQGVASDLQDQVDSLDDNIKTKIESLF
jgi:hypothetical protein